MEMDKGIKFDSMKKLKKKTIYLKFDEFIMKVDVKCFGFNVLQDFKFMKSVV